MWGVLSEEADQIQDQIQIWSKLKSLNSYKMYYNTRYRNLQLIILTTLNHTLLCFRGLGGLGLTWVSSVTETIFNPVIERPFIDDWKPKNIH